MSGFLLCVGLLSGGAFGWWFRSDTAAKRWRTFDSGHTWFDNGDIRSPAGPRSAAALREVHALYGSGCAKEMTIEVRSG
jgi:hypothetical protein